MFVLGRVEGEMDLDVITFVAALEGMGMWGSVLLCGSWDWFGISEVGRVGLHFVSFGFVFLIEGKQHRGEERFLYTLSIEEI